MSEFTIVDVVFSDEQALIESLNELGYKPVVSEEAQNLYGYQGDKRVQTAHIIIPRNQIGNASNDIGFERQGDGKYKVIISEYDSSARTFNMNKLKNFYAQKVIEAYIANSCDYTIESKETLSDGRIRIKISSL